MNNSKILDVKNLRISFRTLNGTVKAVRGIDFSLYRGRTLAIVGESGSGKSVTSRAIMGILANNKIVEEGEILYDGKDLLRISEEEYTKIRGSKISMIFQDPMSSLNPIMKVGKQVVESMRLKDQSSKRHAKKTFNRLSKALLDSISIPEEKNQIKNELKTITKNFVVGENVAFSELLKTKIEELIFVNNEKRKENSTAAIALLEKLLEDGLIGDDSLDTKALLKIKKEVSRKVSICENKLRRTRDSIISTYSVSYSHFIKEYINTIKRENKEAKEEAKKQKLIEKGKSVEDSSKKKAFASEIDTSHMAVASHLKEITLNVLARLKELEVKEISQKEARTAAFLEYLCQCLNEIFTKHTKEEYRNKAVTLLKEVGIPEPEKRLNQYPFQFSGGMRQRIVIAIALASNPDILICDEPTTALDVTIQAQILELINRIKRDRNLSIIFITHNLGVVANMADDIAVMYAGKIVEFGTVDDIFYDPKHPYTWALLSSMPDLETKEKLDAIPGTPPNMIIPPKGDAFALRNKYALKIDFEEEPPFFKVSDTHYAATWLLAPKAPKVEPPKIVVDRISRMKKLNSAEETNNG